MGTYGADILTVDIVILLLVLAAASEAKKTAHLIYLSITFFIFASAIYLLFIDYYNNFVVTPISSYQIIQIKIIQSILIFLFGWILSKFPDREPMWIVIPVFLVALTLMPLVNCTVLNCNLIAN